MSERLPPAPPPGELPPFRDDELIELGPGDSWGRVFRHAGRYPSGWDDFRTVPLAKPGRFDAFAAPNVDGVAYIAIPAAADDATIRAPGDRSVLATSIAEIAQDQRALGELDQRTFVVAELIQRLVLLDVSSDWATRAGAGAHLSTAPRMLTSHWGEAIATNWPELAGVAYIASTRPAGRAVAAWAPRAAAAITSSLVRLHRRLDDPVLKEPLSWAADVTGTALLP